jgi:hypothetical protein
MSFAFVGENVPLAMVLADHVTSMSPRARIYNGTTLVSTVALVSVSTGYYYATWLASSPGRFEVVYDVFTDPGFLNLSPLYSPGIEEIHVMTGPVAEEGGAVRQSYTLDTNSNSIIVNLWLEVDSNQVATGVSNANLTLCKQDGTVLASPSAQASPVAQGVFLFTFPIPPFAIGENATFSFATVDFAGPPARTFRGVTGVTFSRSA